jgi:hypothetical protein
VQDVERQRSEAEARLATEAGKELKLATEQLAEYNRLKGEAGVRTAPLRAQIDKLKREATVEKVKPANRQWEVRRSEH